MGVKKCSFASAEETQALTGMEIGGVTALGLHDGRGARDGGDRGDTHAHGRFAGDLNSRNRGGADGANGTARGCAGTGEHGSLSRHSRHDEGHFSPTYADRRSYDVE